MKPNRTAKTASKCTFGLLMALVAIGFSCLIPSSAWAVAPPYISDDVYYEEISGSDRYATAVKTVDELVHFDVTGIIITTGEAYPDTLSASSLAGLLNYPVLLNPLNRIPDVVMDCLLKHKPEHIIIIGDENAVNKSVEETFLNLSFINKVERIGGSNRYETSKAIYEYGKTVGSGWTSDTAVLATGENFADGVSVAPYATSCISPLFLVDKTTNVDQATYNALNSYKRVLLIGDSTRISEKTEKALIGLGSITEVKRLAGSNRYETNLEVRDFYYQDTNDPDFPRFDLWHYIASGSKFPDALTVGISGALNDGYISVFLADDTPQGKTFLKKLGGKAQSIYRIYFVGTQAATTPGLREATIKGIGGNPIIQY